MKKYSCPHDGQEPSRTEDQVDNFSDLYRCPSAHKWAVDGFHGPAYGFEVVEVRD